MKIATDHNRILATTVYVYMYECTITQPYIIHIHTYYHTHYVFLVTGSPEMYVHD